ncbi:MAG: flagellar filament capping protein FliD, partial [Gemmatimonadetes bacterium]|nr:flagellar filament capping protein FliD [Gemmatimonadota bacterium]
VTFNLLAAEAGTAVDVTVTRDLAGAVTAMKAFASAYNEVRSWAATNSAIGKRLEGNTSLRTMVSALSSQLLTTVTGVTGSYTTAATAGVTRDKYGTLSVDATVLTNALTTNFEDVTRLFSQAGVPSDATVTYLGSSDSTKAGTYAVQITRAATTGGVIGSPIVSPYAGASDTMTVVDAGTGKTGSVTLASGDSIDKVVAGLNSSFSANKMHLVASNSGGKISIASSDYGSTGGISVSYAQGLLGEGETWMAIATGSDALTRFDVQGYIGVAGHAGEVLITGSGRTLTATTGTNAAGLQLSYTGSADAYSGTLAYSVGVGGMLYNVATSIARELDGQVAVLSKTAITQADAMTYRIQNAQDRLANRRAAMIAQFIAMESAMSKAQSVSTSLTSQINGLFNYNKTA